MGNIEEPSYAMRRRVIEDYKVLIIITIITVSKILTTVSKKYISVIVILLGRVILALSTS